MSALLYTPAITSDLAALVTLEEACFRDPWTRASLEAQLDTRVHPYARLRCLRAEPTSPPLAYLLAWEIAGEAQLHRLAVWPDCQGQGLGKTLLSAWIAELRRQAPRVQTITLEVREHNEVAYGLYRQLGFVEVGLRPRYYADTGEAARLLDLRLEE